MGAMASQATSLTIVYLTVYSGTEQRKHQSSASLAFVRGIHRWPPHKGPVTQKMFPFDDVIMTLPMVVNTSPKHIHVGDTKAFNTETIYARAVSLVRSCHVLDTNQFLSYELAQHASSRFDSIGLMHELKTKANLRNALKLKLSARPTEKASWCDFSMGVQSWVDALTYQWHCAGLFE